VNSLYAANFLNRYGRVDVSVKNRLSLIGQLRAVSVFNIVGFAISN
jgi:hypothetical protein